MRAETALDTTPSGHTEPSIYRPGPAARVWALLLIVWWLIFAGISLYWACGGLWLVDTAVQAEGVELSKQRPAWLVLLLLVTVIAKAALAGVGYLLVAPLGRRIPRWLFWWFGFLVGVGMIGYGLLFTLPVLSHLDEMTEYGWMRMLVWMPQFWVGGILLIVATFTCRPLRRPLPA